MERLQDLKVEEQRVLGLVNTCVGNIRELVESDVNDLSLGIETLANIRATAYEEINQLQHEALILHGVRWLGKNHFPGDEIEWWWNPRQTGGSDEPDLLGKIKERVVVSAEATTSSKPQGVIDTRMANTLEKLHSMQGAQWYFVRTEPMERRAKTKVAKRGYPIHVQRLSNNTSQAGDRSP